jgi:hypothetical protein
VTVPDSANRPQDPEPIVKYRSVCALFALTIDVNPVSRTITASSMCIAAEPRPSTTYSNQY